MEFSEEDFLGLFNRLFERLQQAGLVSGSNTHLHAVYVAKGAQYVETQMNYTQPLPGPPQKGRGMSCRRCWLRRRRWHCGVRCRRRGG